MIVQKAFKFRLYPNQDQSRFLDKTFGCCRFLYNQMLSECKEVYQSLKDDRDALYKYKYRTEKQYKELFLFLNEVDSVALQSSRERLKTAFDNFFRGLKRSRYIGYPRFHSRKDKQSFTAKMTNNNLKIDFVQKRLKLPKMRDWIKFEDDRIFNEPMRTITVSRTKSGKYYASIFVQQEVEILPKKEVEQGKIIAFDMSANNFLISERMKLDNPRFYRNDIKKIARVHRRHSRTKKGSKNREKARIKLCRVYDTIYNRKYDWMHKITAKLSENYDAIILEDLNIDGMKRFSKGICKSVTLDFSWSEFVTTLKYKMEWKGKQIILIDRFFPSSKICSSCGYKKDDLKLSDRNWICPNCHAEHDRDINASENILSEGIKILKSKSIMITLPSERREVTPLEIV